MRGCGKSLPARSWQLDQRHHGGACVGGQHLFVVRLLRGGVLLPLPAHAAHVGGVPLELGGALAPLAGVVVEGRHDGRGGGPAFEQVGRGPLAAGNRRLRSGSSKS